MMTKDSFLRSLRDRLLGLPQDEIEERLSFYCETIADRMEEGLSEEAAVLAMGTVDEIVAQIIPDSATVSSGPYRNVWQNAWLIVGSPVWISLLIAAITVVVSVYISMWAVVVSLWAVLLAVAVCVPGSLLAGICSLCTGGVFSGTAMIATAIICAGCTILLFLGCKATTMGILFISKKVVLKLKMRSKKEEVV